MSGIKSRLSQRAAVMVNRNDERLKRLWQDILKDISEISSTSDAIRDEYHYVQQRLRLLAVGGESHSAVLVSGRKVWVTVRERQVLFGLCRGLSAMEIARGIQLSHRTVEYYTSNLKAKFQVFSKNALIDLVVTRTHFMADCQKSVEECCAGEIKGIL